MWIQGVGKGVLVVRFRGLVFKGLWGVDSGFKL